MASGHYTPVVGAPAYPAGHSSDDPLHKAMLAVWVRAGRWSWKLMLAQEGGDLEKITFIKSRYLEALRDLRRISPPDYDLFIGDFPDPLRRDRGST